MPHDNHNSPNDESSDLPDEMTLRVKSLETILTKKGLIDPKTLDEIIDFYSNKVGPKNGAYVVAKSWTDDKFRTQILKDPDKVLKELANDLIVVPKTNHYAFVIFASIVLQLLAYHIALGKKLNVDQPRNLAKSVSVE